MVPKNNVKRRAVFSGTNVGSRLGKLGRAACIFLVCLLSAVVFAQGSHVGVNGGVLVALGSGIPPEACVGVQIGTNISPNFAVRVFGDVLPFAATEGLVFRVAGDLLYTGELAADTTGYFGGGAGILVDTTPDVWFPVLPDVHLTGGVEYRISDEVGVYGEAQLLYITPVFRAGVNYHF